MKNWNQLQLITPRICVKYCSGALFDSDIMRGSCNVQLDQTNKRQRIENRSEAVNITENSYYEHREDYSLVRNTLEEIEEIEEMELEPMYI